MVADNEIDKMAKLLGQTLLERGITLAVAESCTGGWVCQAITEVAGSSAWFDRGFVTYSNAAKQELLGVPPAVLERFGAVSEQTVQAMTQGCLARSQADCAIAISGIAGPAGGSADKPVGTVWLAWQRRGEACLAYCEHFDGDRHGIRRRAVIAALYGVLALYG